jgi:hypothetical protein
MALLPWCSDASFYGTTPQAMLQFFNATRDAGVQVMPAFPHDGAATARPHDGAATLGRSARRSGLPRSSAAPATTSTSTTSVRAARPHTRPHGLGGLAAERRRGGAAGYPENVTSWPFAGHGDEVAWGSVTLSRCTAAHPCYIRITNTFGTFVNRHWPNPRSATSGRTPAGAAPRRTSRTRPGAAARSAISSRATAATATTSPPASRTCRAPSSVTADSRPQTLLLGRETQFTAGSPYGASPPGSGSGPGATGAGRTR